ncbi:MAG: cobamide remodeling phosphodiesterase CbiR [Thermodesulfobacteriota bacterium]
MTPLIPSHHRAEPAGKGLCDSYRQLQAKLKDLPWRVAAPSFTIPAGVADNCRFLDGLVEEVALLFLETRSCLDYGPDDLPPWLTGLGLAYHVHLPLDLPWDQGPGPAMDAALALAAKAAFLAPRAFVLHPPRDLGLLPRIAERWRDAGQDAPLLLENTALHGPESLDGPARTAGLGLCLDLGHAMAYGHGPAAESLDFGRVGMLHLSAPGRGDEHLPLDRLSGAGRDLLRRWLARLPREATLTVEVFNVEGLARSLECLASWTADWGLAR